MLKINQEITPGNLEAKLEKLWALSGKKIVAIDREYDSSQGAPVFTAAGKYTTRGWTEWTQGFQFGSSILHFDATGEKWFLENGRRNTVDKMAPHLSHTGVHDHGFNNLSTYGNLLRLMKEGKIPFNEWEKSFYELAIKVSGAVQASRWTPTRNGGFIYSFNGPHSLFVDTIRSCRILMVSHLLGHTLMAENDARISLMQRALQHMESTARYSVFYGEGRDSYDVWGRTAHEAVFNTNDGNFRCPNSQQGYTGFSTWTRGLAWAMLGFAEEIELLETLPAAMTEPIGNIQSLREMFVTAARATCDFYIENTPTDGIPYWDTGAPNLHRLGDYLNQPADPFNNWEPVDASAAAIGAQGLLRLGKFLGPSDDGRKYWQAGLTVMDRLMEEPYLSTDETHHGLLLHSIYHQPNGWDYVPPGSRIACGESSMWGDYHLREAALCLTRMNRNEGYYTFFGCV
jgi:unsaturated chondroitin disaccharide hydrolase